jgi:CheY-like chemotaxis protein
MSNKLILIVDDEQDFVKTTALRLRFEGYDVVEAGDGITAVKSAKEHTPDLILLDIMMPGMNGVEVCDKLRTDPETSRIPIIFLTVWERLLPGAESKNKDIYRHLIKPFDFNKLIEMIRDMIE